MKALQKFKQYGTIQQEVLDIIESDEDFKAGFEKAYLKQKEYIRGLPLEKQFNIVLSTVSFAAMGIREYQEDQRMFEERLKAEYPETPKTSLKHHGKD